MSRRDMHIVYTEDGVHLSVAPHSSWQEVQAAYPKYKASLGPWSGAEVVEFLADEYPDLVPSAAEQVRLLLASQAQDCVVTFRDGSSAA